MLPPARVRSGMPRASEARYRTLFEVIDQGFCTIEVLCDEAGRAVDYRFCEVNPAFVRATGLVDAVSKRMRELEPAHEARWFEIYGRVARTGEAIRFEQAAAALGRWYNVYAFRVGEPDAPRVAVLFEDITARKRAEGERDLFIEAAAHDLRTPITSLKAQVQLLRRRLQRGLPDPDALASGLAEIEAAGDRMVALISEMMDAAHLREKRTLDLKLAVTDLAALVEVAAAQTRQRSTRHHVEVERQELSLVGEWDPARLDRVVANLLDNAVKYSPAGAEIRVRVGRVEDPDGTTWAKLEIKDQGVGIPLGDLPHVFERFHRGANVGTIGGTGIGLAGAKQIIQQHGGTIAVVSEEGAGTTVTVQLPLIPLPRSSGRRNAELHHPSSGRGANQRT